MEQTSVLANESLLIKYVTSYQFFIKTKTQCKVVHVSKYLKGLFQSRKQNIERIREDVVDTDYISIQHFIS